MSWSDASGAGRKLCAVVRHQEQYFYTWCVMPQWLEVQLIPRDDHFIGAQEMVAVLLTLSTFEDLLEGRCWSAFVDNDGVLAGILKATCRSPETGLCIGWLWKKITVLQIGFMGWRVESKANVADGPTRGNFEEMLQLKALFRPAVWPAWLEDLWRPRPSKDEYL